MFNMHAPATAIMKHSQYLRVFVRKRCVCVYLCTVLVTNIETASNKRNKYEDKVRKINNIKLRHVIWPVRVMGPERLVHKND